MASEVGGNPEDSGNSKPREEFQEGKKDQLKGLAAEQEVQRSSSALVTATSKKPGIILST